MAIGSTPAKPVLKPFLASFFASASLALTFSLILLYNTRAQLQFAFYVFAFLGLSYHGLSYIKKVRAFDPLAPGIVLIALLFLYSYAGAAFLLKNGCTLYGEVVSAVTLTKYFISCLFSLVAILWGTAVSARWRSKGKLLPFLQRNLDDRAFLRRIVFWTALLCTPLAPSLLKAFDFRQAQPYSETAFLSRVLYAEQGASQGLREYFTYMAPLYLVLACAVLLVFRAKPTFKVAGLLLLFLNTLTMFLSGSRTALAIVFILVLTFYHYRVKRLSLFAIVGILLLGVLMANVVSLLRFTSDPMTMLQAAKEFFTSEDTKVASVSQSGELLTAQNLMRLIQGIDRSETGYTFGGSLLTELLTFVPKALMPSRPLTLAESFVDIFYPGVLESGGGLGFFFVMDGYWAGGYLGVILFCFLYGLLIDRFYSWFSVYAGSDAMAILYGVALFPLAMFSVRSGLIISLKTTLMDIAPILFVMLLPDVLGTFQKVRSNGS